MSLKRCITWSGTLSSVKEKARNNYQEEMNITTQYFQKIGGKWSKGFRNLRSKYVDAASFLAQKMETEVLINLVKL